MAGYDDTANRRRQHATLFVSSQGGWAKGYAVTLGPLNGRVRSHRRCAATDMIWQGGPHMVVDAYVRVASRGWLDEAEVFGPMTRFSTQGPAAAWRNKHVWARSQTATPPLRQGRGSWGAGVLFSRGPVRLTHTHTVQIGARQHPDAFTHSPPAWCARALTQTELLMRRMCTSGPNCLNPLRASRTGEGVLCTACC